MRRTATNLSLLAALLAALLAGACAVAPPAAATARASTARAAGRAARHGHLPRRRRRHPRPAYRGRPAHSAAARRPARGRGLRTAHRAALGRRGSHPFGSRAMRAGNVGWDVAGLQFQLAAHGFPSGPVDGALGPRSVAALQRLQAWAGLPADGIAGAATLRALRAPPPRSPVALRPPVAVAVGDRYSPRGSAFHAGVDFPAATGTPVGAAGFGTVVSAATTPRASATWSSSATASGCERCTPTSPRSTCAPGRRSAPGSASAPSAPPVARADLTCTSSCDCGRQRRSAHRAVAAGSAAHDECRRRLPATVPGMATPAS